MGRINRSVAGILGILLLSTAGITAAEERVDVAELQKRTDVYFEPAGQTGKIKVKLSPEMAARVIEVIGGKPQPFTPRGGPKAAPAGRFLVGERAYDFYCFLYFQIDPKESWGHSWQDPSLRKFWAELQQVGEDYGRLKAFKP